MYAEIRPCSQKVSASAHRPRTTQIDEQLPAPREPMADPRPRAPYIKDIRLEFDLLKARTHQLAWALNLVFSFCFIGVVLCLRFVLYLLCDEIRITSIDQ